MDALLPNIEQFEDFRPAQIGIQILPSATLPRAAFRNGIGGELLQVQPDRFAYNWIKTGDDHEYPHSEKTLERFFELLEKFTDFLTSRNLGEISIIQCELTNVNIVPVDGVGDSFADVATVLRLPDIVADCPNMKLENQMFGSKHLMLNDVGKPVGRVHCVGQPSLRVPSNEQVFRLDIAARGAPIGPGVLGASKFFEDAVSAINAVFLATTTKAGRQFWGEIDA